MRILHAATTEKALKRKFIIERLKEFDIVKTKDGRSIHDLNYKELRLELVLARIRQIDVSSDANKWF